MPFTPIIHGPNKGKYRSLKSGKIYTKAQVELYNQRGRFPKPGERKKENAPK